MLSSDLTDTRQVPLFEEDTDLIEYTLLLLGMVEQMNADRVSVRDAVVIHNGTPKGNSKG